MNLAIASAGALPALAAMGYVDWLDRKRPEPRALLRRVAMAGALMALPALGAEYLLGAAVRPTSPAAAVLFIAFVVAAAVEELAKLATVRIFVWDAPEVDERLDGIVYGTRAGLGFALVENVWYLANLPGDTAMFVYVFLARALLAVPGHATWAGFMGYFAARRRFDGRGPGFAGGYLLAVLLHGTYDAAVFSFPLLWAQDRPAVYPLLLVPVAIVVGGVVVLRHLAHKALLLDDIAEARARAAGAEALERAL
jgi:protease PrsW